MVVSPPLSRPMQNVIQRECHRTQILRWLQRNKLPVAFLCPVKLSSTASSVLARELNIRVTDSVVSRQRIGATKCLLFCTQIAVHLLLLSVVDRILVPCQVVRTREDGIARLARAWVDAVTAVGSGLAVEQARGHTHVVVVWPSTCKSVRLPVALTLVLLQQVGRLKP